MKCSRCGCSKFRKYGYVFSKGHKVQNWQCTNCGATHAEGTKRPAWLIKQQREQYHA